MCHAAGLIDVKEEINNEAAAVRDAAFVFAGLPDGPRHVIDLASPSPRLKRARTEFAEEPALETALGEEMDNYFPDVGAGDDVVEDWGLSAHGLLNFVWSQTGWLKAGLHIWSYRWWKIVPQLASAAVSCRNLTNVICLFLPLPNLRLLQLTQTVNHVKNKVREAKEALEAWGEVFVDGNCGECQAAIKNIQKLLDEALG